MPSVCVCGMRARLGGCVEGLHSVLRPRLAREPGVLVRADRVDDLARLLEELLRQRKVARRSVDL